MYPKDLLAPPVDDLSRVVPQDFLPMINEFHSVKAVGDPAQVVPQLEGSGIVYCLTVAEVERVARTGALEARPRSGTGITPASSPATAGASRR